uniref:Uncharacterized protein n=1 Tax=Meloidogyne enterolobii TaxID=390850 RepID=A0A6V7W2Q9_MELEN|nr:unnamed protein product [Meloidogyne enterolobii]
MHGLIALLLFLIELVIRFKGQESRHHQPYQTCTERSFPHFI